MSERTEHEDLQRDANEESERRRLIAEAAYYEAERRGFTGDRTLDDWLEAEARIDGRAARAGSALDDAARQLETPGPNATEPATRANEAVPARREAAAETETIAPDQVQPWARRLKVSPVRLREAIRRIGTAVKDVKGYLQRGAPAQSAKREPRR